MISPEVHGDQRGSFNRTFCRREFAAAGLEGDFVQGNISRNRRRGTLRGLHYQAGEAAEVKLVSCVQGALFDVVVDLRPHSPGYGSWFGLELSAAGGELLYVPRGLAHGFQTLVDDTTVSYLMSSEYEPAAARGLRFDDSALAIDWPLPDPILAERDRAWPDFKR